MLQLIQKATNSQSNEERRQAEAVIVEMREHKPEQFFTQISEIFMSNDTPQHLREASGTLIAVSVLAKIQNGTYVWDSLSGNTKNVIKSSILSVLIDPSRNVRRAAANIVSSICYLELPRNSWEGIVQKICQNVSYDNEVVKQSSILTLGFICSRMKQNPEFTFSTQLQQSILSGLILGLQQTSVFIIDTALKALRDSIESFQLIISNKNYRDFILKQLVAIINNQKYVVDGLQIIGQFVKTAYPYLDQYIDGIIQLLDPSVANIANEDACVAGMEVYENIANQYKVQSQTNPNAINYITGNYGQRIVTSLLKNLIVMEDDTDENDDNPISDSASKALQTIFQNGSAEYKDLVLQFVNLQIGQGDWKNRQASIKAFSLLLYGLPDEQNQALISRSFNQLMGLLGDKSRQVQFAALDSLTIITEVCGKFVLQSPHFVDYLKLILGKLQTSEKFLKTGCKIIDNLCEDEKQNGLGKFTDISDSLIEFFLNFALGPASPLSVVSWSTTTIMNIIEVTKNQTVIMKYILFILQNFDKIGQLKEIQKKEIITSAFFTILQFCLHSLKNTQLDGAIVQAIYTKVTSSFKEKKDVNSDGFYAIQALVPFFNGNMAVLNDFWAYIVHALSKWQDPTLFKATMSSISSFVTCYGNSISDKLDTFVPTLFELLENPNFNKQLKLDCLLILGDVFLICGKPTIKYLQKFLQVIMLCCAYSIQIAETDFSYSQNLKDSIIQTLMCIVHGFNTQPITKQANELIKGFIPSIFEFVNLSCNKKSRPTVNYLKKSLLLLADFGKFYPQNVKPLKSQPFIGQCLNTLKTVSKNKEHNDTIRYVEQQLK